MSTHNIKSSLKSTIKFVVLLAVGIVLAMMITHLPDIKAAATSGFAKIAAQDGQGALQQVRTDTAGALAFPISTTAAADAISNSAATLKYPDNLVDRLVYPRMFGHLFNGATWDRARSASVSTLTAASNVGAVLVDKAARLSVTCSTAGTQCTASVAAGAAGTRHVADCIVFSASTSTAPTQTDLTLLLRDGASGAGTILLRHVVTATATTGNLVPPYSQCGLALIGSDATAMTFEWSAGLSNLRQVATLTYYDVQ